jgi:pilus assembly protein Flp/PilA
MPTNHILSGANTAASTLRAMKKLLRFLLTEDGPTAVEYAVMMALIVLVCFGAIKSVGSATATSFSNSSLSITNAIAS